ncbi:MAG: transcription termination factor Rho [Sphaerochaetaceae bacterium]
MSEDLFQDDSQEKPKKVVLRRKPVVVSEAPSLFEEAAKPEAPVIIDKPRSRRPFKKKQQPEPESNAVEPAKPVAVEETRKPVAVEETRKPEAAEEPEERTESDSDNESRPSDQNDDYRRDRYRNNNNNKQRNNRNAYQHGKPYGKNQNGGGYQNQKKNITMDDVCVTPAEYEEHKQHRILINNLSQTSTADLKQTLSTMIEISADTLFDFKKQDAIFEIIRAHINAGGVVYASGTLEVLPEGYGFLRSPQNSYLAGPEDVYISSMHIKYLNLKTGDTIEGIIRTPKENEKYFAISKIAWVNWEDPVKAKTRASFDSLTPLYPEERINLEVEDPAKIPSLTGMSNDSSSQDVSMRIINMFCPIGKGQRALITAPPRTGKTILLQQIANAITANHPEITLMVLLVDERPEEVTDMKRNVKGEVIASTFDEQASRHVQVAEMVIEKAKRLVEHKKDVVILLDSITRLARAYNQTVPASGKILSGGVDSNALHRPKRFFGAARNVEEGGSLTIIASALIETGSRMDEVIFEEFKGTGNCEIVLDRRMSDRRIFPAINIKKSGTRREELLLGKDEAARIWVLRNAINNFEDVELTEFLIDKIRKTKNNEMFLRSMNSGATPV